MLGRSQGHLRAALGLQGGGGSGEKAALCLWTVRTRCDAWPTSEPLGTEPSGLISEGGRDGRLSKLNGRLKILQIFGDGPDHRGEWLPQVKAQEWLAAEDRTEWPLAAKGEPQGLTRAPVLGKEAWGGSHTWPRVGRSEKGSQGTRETREGLPQRMASESGRGCGLGVEGTAENLVC